MKRKKRIFVDVKFSSSASISTIHSSIYSFIRPKKWKVNYSKKENLRQIRFSSFVLFQRHIPPYISLYVRKSGLFEKRESSSNSILLLLFQRYTPLYFFIRPKKWKVDYSKKEDLRRYQIRFSSLLCSYFNDTLLRIFLYTSEKGELFEKRGSSSNSILLFGSISIYSSVYFFIRTKKVDYSKKEDLRQIFLFALFLFQRYIPPYISLYVRKS